MPAMGPRWTALALLSVVAVLTLAAPRPAWAGDVRVEQAWARATPGKSRNGAAYITISNHGASADRLVAAATPAAKRAEVHTHLMAGGIMRMRPAGAIEVKPGEPVVFRPGGLHLMLMGLAAPLKEGETFPLTLTFERAGPVEVQVTVRGVGAMGPGGGHMKHGRGMKGMKK